MAVVPPPNGLKDAAPPPRDRQGSDRPSVAAGSEERRRCDMRWSRRAQAQAAWPCRLRRRPALVFRSSVAAGLSLAGVNADASAHLLAILGQDRCAAALRLRLGIGEHSDPQPCCLKLQPSKSAISHGPAAFHRGGRNDVSICATGKDGDFL